MRMSTLFALTFLALLAGCNSSNAPAPTAPPAKPIADHIDGRVMLREPRELSEQAKLELKIADVAHPDVVLAQTTVSPANQPPIAFHLPIDVSKVDAKRTYAVEAILTDGDRRYLPVLQYPVLTHNAPAVVEVVVAPEPTPAEKMYEDFKKTLGQIGGMRIARLCWARLASMDWRTRNSPSNARISSARALSSFAERATRSGR